MATRHARCTASSAVSAEGRGVLIFPDSFTGSTGTRASTKGGGGTRLLEGLGHHEGHGFAEIAHLIAVQIGLGPGEAAAVVRLAGGLARIAAIVPA